MIPSHSFFSSSMFIHFFSTFLDPTSHDIPSCLRKKKESINIFLITLNSYFSLMLPKMCTMFKLLLVICLLKPIKLVSEYKAQEDIRSLYKCALMSGSSPGPVALSLHALSCYVAWAGIFLCRWGQPSCNKAYNPPSYLSFSIKNMLLNIVFIKIEVWINLSFSGTILEKLTYVFFIHIQSYCNLKLLKIYWTICTVTFPFVRINYWDNIITWNIKFIWSQNKEAN